MRWDGEVDRAARDYPDARPEPPFFEDRIGLARRGQRWRRDHHGLGLTLRFGLCRRLHRGRPRQLDVALPRGFGLSALFALELFLLVFDVGDQLLEHKGVRSAQLCLVAVAPIVKGRRRILPEVPVALRDVEEEPRMRFEIERFLVGGERSLELAEVVRLRSLDEFGPRGSLAIRLRSLLRTQGGRSNEAKRENAPKCARDQTDQ